jgi:two-component system sensor histidine kinase BaeS
VAGAALLFAALFSAAVARQLTQPIRTLASGTQAVTSGDYGIRIAASRSDELGDLARDFNKLAEVLEKNRASRRRWVADIAHELRTPLAILRGEIDAIEDGVRTFDKATQRSLQTEISRLTKLVGDLHDLSIYDEGGLNGRRDSVDIGVILGNALRSCENRLRDAGIALTGRIANEGAIVTGDETKLGQLFTNLVENTIRYTNAPGKMAVTCYCDDASAVIEFADSPPGVPDRALKHLFERLFRVDASRSRDTGGSGLGLSICKAIVEAHGGTIEARQSELGGLLIRVRLPLTNSQAETA